MRSVPVTLVTTMGCRSAVCASVGQRKPGAISVVRAHPPTRSVRSRTSGLSPAFANKVAAMSPL